MSKIFKESWTEERRKKHSENVKRRYENPDYKKKMSERLKELWKNEEYRKKMVEFSKNKWKNEEYRKKMSEKVKDKVLQNPPTCRPQPRKQLGSRRNPFERDFICNNILSYLVFL